MVKVGVSISRCRWLKSFFFYERFFPDATLPAGHRKQNGVECLVDTKLRLWNGVTERSALGLPRQGEEGC